MRKQVQFDESESSEQDSQELYKEQEQYLRKLDSYKLMAKKAVQKCVPEESDVSENEDDDQALKPCLSPQREAAFIPKNQSEKGLLNGRMTGSGVSRPTTANTFKLKPPLRRIRPNDPVARYQQMSSTWKRDKFLSGGANKKQGRKLELDKRCRQYGLSP